MRLCDRIQMNTCVCDALSHVHVKHQFKANTYTYMNVLYRHIELNLDSESSARGSLKNARAKLKFSFKNDASVNEQDRDGGGTLDRIEVAVGLFKMGI